MYNAEMPPYEQLCQSHRQPLDESVDLLQKRLGCQAEDGHNPSIRSMCLTIDPVQIWGRPFIFYASVKLVNWSIKAYYKSNFDVRHECHGGLE
jgi:hypothetical protein